MAWQLARNGLETQRKRSKVDDDASWRETTVRTAIVFVAASLAVSGCALLPASVQVALLALDGVSFAVSKKSVADHGISIIVQQDCALWRGVTEGQFCYPDGEATMIAKTEDAPDQAIDPVTAWARLELAYRKSAAGNARPSSADAGPYLTIEPETARRPDAAGPGADGDQVEVVWGHGGA